jgi:hypothetical protein
MKKTLVKSRLQDIFKPNGKNSNIGYAAGKAGVYLIYEDGKLVYIGHSKTQLEKTVLRHFYPYNDTNRQQRVYYPDRENIKVRIVLTTPDRAEKLEKGLIIKHQPKDNPDKLSKYLGKVPMSCEEAMAAYERADAATIQQMEDAPF